MSSRRGVTGPGVVALARSDEAAAAGATGLPSVIRFGAGWPGTATIGRQLGNDAVLPLPVASRVHCQLALRRFRLPGKEEVHEALFLRDVSKHRTLVNGVPASLAWHWLKEGDDVGLYKEHGVESPTVLHLYTVRYQVDVTWMSPDEKMAILPNVSTPMYRRPAARGQAGSSKQPGRGRPPQALLDDVSSSPSHDDTKKVVRRFGGQICGRVVDVTYSDTDPPTTYRARVVSYDPKNRWHIIDSKGLSTWEGEDFTDEVDLNAMYAMGSVLFVGVEETALAPKGKRARVHH